MKKCLFLWITMLFCIVGLYAQNCIAPTALSATAHTPEWRNVTLTWTAASDATQQVFGYGTTNSSSVNSGDDFTAVIRLTPTELATYSTRYLSAVQFKPGMSQEECEYSITIWQGGSIDLMDTTITSGSEIRNQIITQELQTGVLNTVYLDNPVAVDATQELWIGVRANHTGQSGFPIGASYNTSQDYKGNLLTNGSTWGLLNLTSQPNNVNWYIFAVFSEETHIARYNVYRDEVLLANIANTSFVDTLDIDGTYIYSVSAVYSNSCESTSIIDSVSMNNDCFISTFPYTENFDGLTGTTLTTVAGHVLPDCWSWVNHGASYPGYPIIYNSSTYSASGTNSLRFYTYNTASNNTTYADQYAILPPIDISIHPINALQLELDARCSSATSTYQFFLEVGVMTSLSDVSTFVPVDTIQCTGTTYGNYIINFSSYTGAGQYIAFKAPKLNTGATVYNVGYVDNITLDEIPTCPKPTDLAADASQVTEQSVTLLWTENGAAAEWVIEYGAVGFTPGSGIMVSATTNHFTISNLAASTPYQFYVRSVCGVGDTSHYSSVLSASTACGALSVLPYTQDFESYTGATSGSTSNIEQACWSHISTGTISSYAGYPIIYNSATYAQSGTNAVRFYCYYTSTYGDEYAVMPAVNTTLNPMNTLQVEFSANKYSSYSLNLIVGVMDDSATVASFVPVDTILVPTTATANEYSTFIVSFENYVGTGNRVAFKAPKPASSYNAGCIDDVILSTIPNCKKPLEVTATGVSYDNVTIDWTPFGDESNWDVVVVPMGTSADAGVINSASAHPFIVDNLTPNTNYDVYVRANCGNEVSPWSNVFSFTTRCAPTNTLPFTENFDSYAAATTAASGVMPTCWEAETDYSSTYPYIYATQHASGTGSLYFYSSTTCYSKAISPALDLSNYSAGDLALSMKVLKTSASYGYLNVYMATNPLNDSTFTLLKAFTPTDFDNPSEWYDYSIVLNVAYTEPVYLVMTAPSGVANYVCVDDIVLEEVPECTSPRNVFVSDIHGVNAQVNWDAAWFGAIDYAVEYAEAGTQNWSAPTTVTGTSYLLTGLDPLTAYDVRVTSNCATGTAAPAMSSFHTLCLIPDEITIGSGTTTSYFIPFYGAYQYSFTQQIYTAAEMNNTAKDINTISFQYTGIPITRTVDIYLMNTTTASLASAWESMEGAQLVYSGDVTMNADLNDDHWNTIVLDSVFHYNGIDNLLIAVNNRSAVSAGTTSSAKTFRTTSATGKGRYAYGTSTAVAPFNPFNMTVSGTSYAYHNNIIFGSCDNTSTCAAPTLSVDNIANESVTISWIAGYQETSWNLQYKAQGDADWTNVGDVTSSPYTIENLAANMQYEIRLRALCTDTSEWATVMAHTVCNSVNVPYTQDFETATGSGAGNFIDCWIRGTNYTTAYPYTYSTYTHDGTYSLYFYGTSSYYSYAAMPMLDESIQMDSLQIRFWARKTSAAYQIQVGIMTNPYDYSTFELLGTFTPSETSTWEEMQLNTSNYEGQGRFIAWRVPAQITSYMCIDDILVQYIPDCPRVQDIEAVNTQAHQTDITWASGTEANYWYYAYGLKDSVSFDLATALVADNDTITLLNLADNTEYDIYVMASCENGENAEAVKYTFTTLCDPIASLPYRESFDNCGGSGSAYYPSCWYRKYVTATTINENYPYVYSTYFNTAPASLYFYGLTSSNTYSVAAMQPMDSSIAMNTLQVDFTLRSSSLSYYMIVGVMTDPNNLDSFVPVDTVSLTATSVFEQKSVSLASYTGTGKYIAFKNYGSMYLDDILVDFIPACDNPTNLVVSNIDQTSAMLNWSAGSTENSWELYVVPSGSGIADATPVIVTDSNYQVASLTAATDYDVYVRAICPGGFGHSGYAMTSFTTACDAVTTLPLTENFDAVTGSTTGSVNNLPTCWNYVNHCTVASYTGYPIVYNSNSYAASGSNSLRFYVSNASTYSDQTAVLPEINTATIPMNTLAVNLDMRKYSASYNSFILEVGVMTDPNVDSTFVAVDTLEVTSTNYVHQVVYLNHYTGTGSYIAFRAPQPSTSYNTGNVDNIVVDLMPSCLRVNNVQTTAVGSHSVTVSWTPSGYETAWIVNYKLSTDTVWQSANASTTAYQLTGLSANTTYDIQVIADCGNSQSDVSNTLTITTDCEDLTTIPYTENFDGYTASTSGTVVNLPTCWHQMNVGYTSSTYAAYPIMYNSSTYAYSGTNTLRFYTYVSGATNYGDQWAVMRSIDTTTIPIQNLQLSLKARKYSTSYPFNLTVGVMSDYSDTSTFVPMATISPSSAEYETFTVYFRHYAGGGKYIALRAASPVSSYNAGYVDNLELSLAPTCLEINDLITTAITANSINLSWTPQGDETAWNISYRQESDTTWTNVTTTGTPTYTLANLLANTTYQFRVQADCGGGDVSVFSNILTATTSCLPIDTLPYFENFDSYAGTQYNVEGATPDCWLTYTDNNTRPAPHVVGSGSYWYPQSQPNALSFVGSSPSTLAFAVLPEFDAALNTLQLSFAYRMESATYGTLKVGYVTDIANLTESFVEVATITSVTTISVDTIDFSTVAANGRIAFQWSYTGTSYYSCNIDNVSVSQIATPTTCDAPTGLNAFNIAQTSANIQWTAGGTETAWNLQYKAASASNWSNSIAVNGTPAYALTGLTANTAYNVRVQADCGAGSTSDWTVANFTTLEEEEEETCPMPTNFHATDVTANSVTLAWEQEAGTATEWEINYRAASADTWTNITVNTNPYTITDLTPETAYQAQILAHCSNGVTSDATEVITFTTTVDGINDYILSNTVLYPNPTTGLLTISNEQAAMNNVNIYDVYGKLLMSVEVNGNVATIDATTFAAGIYFAQIATEKGVVTKRFVKK